jgi:hypothetical protein
MQNRKFGKMKLGQNVGGNSNCATETHSKALLHIAALEIALFAAVVIYDNVFEVIMRGEKLCICWFVHDTTND